MAFIEVAIIGDGSKANPFRADLPPEVTNFQAHIFSNPRTGLPRFATTTVEINDKVVLTDTSVGRTPDEVETLHRTRRDGTP